MIWWGTLVNRMASFVGLYLALFLREEHGFDEAEAGWVVGLWGLGSVSASLLGGVLADRVGRRFTMIAGLVSGGLAVVAIALTRDPVLLPALCFVGGATQQIFFPASSAAIADVVPPTDRDRAYGLVYWAVNLGFAFGFSVAGFVPNLTVLFLADAASTLVFGALVLALVPETRPPGTAHEPVLAGLARVVTDRTYVGLVLLQTVALTVFMQFQLALPLDMQDHGVSKQLFSFLMAANCLGVVVLQPWLTPLLQRFDRSRLLAVSAALFGIGYGLNAVASTFPMYLLGAAFWTVGETVGFPAASSLVANLAPVALRGRYQGLYAMVWGLAMMLSPITGGQVMHRFGAPVLWVGCLVTGMLVALGNVASTGARRRRVAEVAAADRALPEGAAAG